MKGKIKKIIISIIIGISISQLLGKCDNKKEEISANAEISTELNPTIEDYNIEDYPTANYFDITAIKPYTHGGSNNSVVGVSNGLVNSIIISAQDGTNASVIGYTVTGVKLYQVCPYLKVGETYTLSAETQSITKQFVLANFINASIGWHFGQSLTITEEMLNYYLICYGYNTAQGQTKGECIIQKIMINKGEIAYPYTPYYKSFYSYGYEEGVGDGYEEGVGDGYTDGYAEGAGLAVGGIFTNVKISGRLERRLEEESVSFSLTTVPLVLGGINFKETSILQQITTVAQTKWGSDYEWDDTYINIELSAPVPINNFGVYGQGNSTSFIGGYELITTTGEVIEPLWERNENYYYYQTDINPDYLLQNYNIKYINFWWGGGEDGLEVTIYQDNFGFSAGYENGYNTGYDEGIYNSKDYWYDEGYKIGHSDGETVGYNNAVFQGYDGAGLLYGVFQLIKLFFSLVTSLLTLKIAGDYTIGLFVIGIPATFMIIKGVISLVKYFLGNKDNDDGGEDD